MACAGSRGLPRPWLAAVAVRLCVLALGAVLARLGEPYDTSMRITTASPSGNAGLWDAFVQRHLSPFANWDGVYFLTIAQRGYEY